MEKTVSNFGISVLISGVVYSIIFFSIFKEFGTAIFMGAFMGVVSTAFFQALGLNKEDEKVVLEKNEDRTEEVQKTNESFSDMQSIHSNIKGKEPLLVNGNIEASFLEIGRNNIVLSSIKGEYGKLFQDTDNSLLCKVISENSFFSWIVTSSIVMGMHFTHFVLGCSATKEELQAFQDGVKEAYFNLTDNEKKIFTKEDDAEIESYLAIGNQYARLFIDECANPVDPNVLNLDPGGCKSTAYLVEILYSRYNISAQLPEVDEIVQKNITGLEISDFSMAILKYLQESIVRNN